MALTQRQINAHVRSGGLKCPYCGDEQTVGVDMNFEGGSIYQDMRCLVCDRTWSDAYRLANLIEHDGCRS